MWRSRQKVSWCRKDQRHAHSCKRRCEETGEVTSLLMYPPDLIYFYQYLQEIVMSYMHLIVLTSCRSFLHWTFSRERSPYSVLRTPNPPHSISHHFGTKVGYFHKYFISTFNHEKVGNWHLIQNQRRAPPSKSKKKTRTCATSARKGGKEQLAVKSTMI